MSNHPTTPQGSADRAEELRRLSDRELGRELRRAAQSEQDESESPYEVARAYLEDCDLVQAEWDRRCAEREAQESQPEHMSPEELARCVAAIDPEKFATAQREIADGECITLSQAKAAWREGRDAELERLREAVTQLKQEWNAPEPDMANVGIARRRLFELLPQPQDAPTGEEPSE